MSFSVKSQGTEEYIQPSDGALLKYMQKTGSIPKVSLSIYPLENLAIEIRMDRFMSYSFKSSILAPVEGFSCEVFYQTTIDVKKDMTGKPAVRKPREGDIFVLRANNVPVCSGIVDQLDMETDPRSGTKLTIQGRNLLGQWEDQDSVSTDSRIIYADKYTLNQVITRLAQDTRINPSRTIFRDAPVKGYLFATQPGESKLSSMQRYCEALDTWFWTAGDGSLIVGRPDVRGVRGGVRGRWLCKSGDRNSNVLSMRSTRNSTQIPNTIIPIWNGQEQIQSMVPQSALVNAAAGPKRLLHFGHRVPKCVVVSTPQGASPQELADINALLVAGQNATGEITKAGASTLIQAYAKREMAKANIKELVVQANVVGHYNDRAEPLMVDQVYRIQYDDDEINEDMYLYEIEYIMDSKSGAQAKLWFCLPTAIVSDVRAL